MPALRCGLVALMAVLCVGLWPAHASAQFTDPRATPVFFVRSTTTLDAQMSRAAGGAPIDRRALAQTLSLTAQSRGTSRARTHATTRAHTTFDYWFDAGPSPTPITRAARQLEPSLRSAWLELLVAHLRVRAGRQDQWGALGFARIDGLSLAWSPDTGVFGQLSAGVRNQPERWRLDRWDYQPLGAPSDELSAGPPRMTLLDATLGWRGQHSGISGAAQHRWRDASTAGTRVGANLWATPASRLRLSAGVVGDTTIAGVSSAQAGLRWRGDTATYAIEAAAYRPVFEPTSTWIVYPIAASARLGASASTALASGRLTLSGHFARRFLNGWARPGGDSAGGSVGWTSAATARLRHEVSGSVDLGKGVRWGAGRARLSYDATRKTTVHATQWLRAAGIDESSRRTAMIGAVSQLSAVFSPDDRAALAATAALTSDTRDGVGWQLFLAADLQLPGAQW